MTAETFGEDLESVPFWEREATSYQRHMRDSRATYHDGRLETARRLLDQAALGRRSRVLDFGCGEGTFAWELARRGHSVLGVDVAESMIGIAQQGAPTNARFEVAGARQLAEQGEHDLLVSLNVLAYLTDQESEAFWEGARRIVRPGGSLLLSHSNELFDLFALNAGTAAFFTHHFDVDVTPLLTTNEQQNPTYNVRANPLTYPSELRARGFEEVAQAFFNYHPAPPALLGPGDSGRVVDPEAIASFEPWKQALQCSTYFSLATRAD